MWKIFREVVWDKGWWKVLTVIGSLELLYSLYILVMPDEAVYKPAQIDNKVWYVVAIVLLISVIILVLRGASQYKKHMESKDNIRLVYNERYLPCRELSFDEEIIRVGIRTIGIEPVENLIVLPDALERITGRLRYKRIPILQIPLKPMIGKIDRIARGYTPAYYVDVLKHRIGTGQVELCYDNYPSPQISLKASKYELCLIARGTPSESHIRIMTISLDRNYKLGVELNKYVLG